MNNDAFSANDSGLPDGTRRALFALPAVAVAAFAAPGAVLAAPADDPMGALWAEYLARSAACDDPGLTDEECNARGDVAQEIALRILAEPCRNAQDLARKVMIATGFGLFDLCDGSQMAAAVRAEIGALAGADWEKINA